jgi:hypothetical protein
MCRVFLFEPKPIYNRAIVSQSVTAAELGVGYSSPIDHCSQATTFWNSTTFLHVPMA